MASSSTISYPTGSYVEQTKKWPKDGRHILASFNHSTVVVYQAFCPEIASYAVEHGRFGGPKYSMTRMTWIKTNFLWMMYRSSWARAPRQERILALHLLRAGFETILAAAREGTAVTGKASSKSDLVRLQWDPDHDPFGDKLPRRAIQLGLRGDMVSYFNEKCIQKVEDVTDFVQAQHFHVVGSDLSKLIVPVEDCYIPSDVEICRRIRLEGFDGDVGDKADVRTDGGATSETKEDSEDNK